MANDIQSITIKTAQGVGYLSAFILSLLICVPMSMNQDQFKGRCLLFSTGNWQERDGHFIVEWASQAYCNFTIFVAVIMFVISVIQFGRFVKFARRGRDCSFFSAFVDVILCSLMCLFVFIAGCFVSIGFNTWCEQMTKRFPTCDESVGSPIDLEEGIDSNGFYFQMQVAQFGIWFSWSIWIMLLTFSVVKLVRYHNEENLRVSMAKERKRLLNEDLVSEVPVNASYNEPARSRRSQHGVARGQNSTIQHEIEHEGRFEEVQVNVSNEAANQGMINDQEDFHIQEPQAASSPQQPGSSSSPNQGAPVGGQPQIQNSEDASLSSMASSQHSYNSLPKGNQIHIETHSADTRPDLLK